jgi:hypothetical protein
MDNALRAPNGPAGKPQFLPAVLADAQRPSNGHSENDMDRFGIAHEFQREGEHDC